MRTRKAVVVFLTMGLFSFIGKVKALEVGSPAPDIAAPDQNGAEFRFADAYAKGPTLVFFYPKASTPGCTAQACSLRDAFENLKAENLQIIGVSRDTAKHHRTAAVRSLRAADTHNAIEIHTLAHVHRARRRRREAATEPLWPDAVRVYVTVAA